jgi:hypothetical protein
MIARRSDVRAAFSDFGESGGQRVRPGRSSGARLRLRAGGPSSPGAVSGSVGGDSVQSKSLRRGGGVLHCPDRHCLPGHAMVKSTCFAGGLRPDWTTTRPSRRSRNYRGSGGVWLRSPLRVVRPSVQADLPGLRPRRTSPTARALGPQVDTGEPAAPPLPAGIPCVVLALGPPLKIGHRSHSRSSVHLASLDRKCTRPRRRT